MRASLALALLLLAPSCGPIYGVTLPSVGDEFLAVYSLAGRGPEGANLLGVGTVIEIEEPTVTLKDKGAGTLWTLDWREVGSTKKAAR